MVLDPRTMSLVTLVVLGLVVNQVPSVEAYNIPVKGHTNTSAARQQRQQSCQCGLANLPKAGRVIGGEKIDIIRKYPWLVLVKIKYLGEWATCTGSLISSGHVLTAGHCVHIKGKKFIPSEDVKVHIGDHNVKNKDDDLPGETSIMKVTKIITHPNFISTSKKIDYDIALLKLEKQLDLDQFEYVRPICLPENADLTYIKIQAIFAGWGRTKSTSFNTPKTPYEITLKTTNNKCRSYEGPKEVTDTQICTTVLWEVETPFHGDSGGPLMVEEDGRFIEIGIVSGGRTETEKVGSKGIAVYTSVTKLLEWIEKKIKDDNRCI